MSGCLRRCRQGATLAAAFGAAVAMGAATGAWGQGSAEVAGAQSRPAVVDRSESQVARGDERPALLAGASPRAADGVDGADGAVEPWGATVTGTGEASGLRGLEGLELTAEEARALIAASGDEWAAYYDPERFESFESSLEGHYTGVGLWVRPDDGGRTVRIDGVRPGGPAARAGVVEGDRLLAVDGVPVSGLASTEVVALLRGGSADSGAGSAVALRLAGADGAEREVRLVRELLSNGDVAVDRLSGGVTRIAVETFSSGVAAQVREAMQQAGRDAEEAADAAVGHGGVVLDLRGNSGGLVSEAVATASVFLDGGVVALYDGPNGLEELRAEPGGDARTPLVVLVDGATRSAGELVAAALQDRGRAVVVGSTTFGKGTVQEPSTLADGSVVERTVGEYFGPQGRRVDGVGVRPDLPVEPGEPAEVAERQALTVLAGLAPAG
ncbi:S41 family peptidase [Allostreptomyces psammosilenae]|uniref:Carboxyl-terminal processing protease n=1 Tax=Allostreptomyces psammosilenae TaxID=1892865 RepID=A0A853A6Y0_9ACTN|nr:S41 family peptidase [Allostreptomyces psammosilenae]NYI06212.1 carboxyl-terminal processing protease [Allostreptomyces psammosilenae]